MLNTSLINDDQEIYFPEQHSKIDLVVGQFEVGKGPLIFLSTIEGLTENIGDELFPSKWKDGSYFIFKTNSLYFFCKCLLASNISTSRGSLQVTYALISSSLIFDKYCDPIFQSIEQTIRSYDSVNFDSTQILATFQNSLSNLPIMSIRHPLSLFTDGSFVCSYFDNNPKLLLYLWKARLLGYKIAINSDNSLSEITNLTYFLSACSIFPNLTKSFYNDTFFHIALCASDKVNADWKLCYLTHPILQESIQADIILNNRSDNYSISRDKKWIKKGDGSIIDSIKDAIEKKNDKNLLFILLHLNHVLFNYLQNTEFIDSNEINSFGLNSMNKSFITQLVQTYHFNCVYNSCC